MEMNMANKKDFELLFGTYDKIVGTTIKAIEEKHADQKVAGAVIIDTMKMVKALAMISAEMLCGESFEAEEYFDTMFNNLKGE